MNSVRLKDLLVTPVKNGYSPICVDDPTGKWVLGLGALDGSGIDTREVKPVPIDNTKTVPYTLENGDFLISRSNTLDKVGRAALYRGGLENCSYPDLMMRFRVHEKKVFPDFLEEYLQSNVARRYFMRCAAGTSGSMVKITKSVVEKLVINLPSLVDQKSIAEIAASNNAIIKKTEALINAKERQFEWLVTRLINNSDYKKRQLYNFITEVSKRNRSNEIDCVLSVTNRSGFVLSEDQFERRVASVDVTNYKIVQQGQYAYNPSRINVGSIARLDDWSDGILSPMYTVFKLEQAVVDSDYFLHWLASGEAKQRIKKSAQGSVRETVSFGDLGAIPIHLPDLSIQKNIVNTLNAAKGEITLLKKLADQYRMQKRGLMQKLLSGEWHMKNKGTV